MGIFHVAKMLQLLSIFNLVIMNPLYISIFEGLILFINRPI